jgi:hypothetical protein
MELSDSAMLTMFYSALGCAMGTNDMNSGAVVVNHFRMRRYLLKQMKISWDHFMTHLAIYITMPIGE